MKKKSLELLPKTTFILNVVFLSAFANAETAQRNTTHQMRVDAALRNQNMQLTSITPVPGGQPNYFGPEANYANSPSPKFVEVTYPSGYVAKRSIQTGTGMRKFIDPLPGLGPVSGHPELPYIPIAVPGTLLGDDYYEIELGQYTQKFHTDLANASMLRGYRQTGSEFQYLGPYIHATQGRAVRIRFTNALALSSETGPDNEYFLPVDQTVMGAGMGPQGLSYSSNRAVLHLHGGHTPWVCDGTAHQWITPDGEDGTEYVLNGVSFRDVPDMLHIDGTATYYYPNKLLDTSKPLQPSARLMFIHDHSYGSTRQNVYSGQVMPYLLTDAAEEEMIADGILPNQGVSDPSGNPVRYGIPLIIQDKTFLPDEDLIVQQDPTWNWGPSGDREGWLWFPHVYMPNQNPADSCVCNNFGRWDYAPWFWPPVTAAAGFIHGAVEVSPNVWIPGTPNPSIVPEAFMDTPIVNGRAYPYLNVERKAYRFRILNGCNDRFLNLQLYYADPLSVSVIDGGQGYTEAPTVTIIGNAVRAARAIATTENGAVTSVEITDPGSGYITAPTVVFSGGGEDDLIPASAVSSINTEVKMAPACPTYPFPSYYPTPDGRAGGFPDPDFSGPEMIQIGTEGGFLPAPVVLKNTPIGFQYNRRDIVVLNVLEKTLFLGPAERADVVIDFSQVPEGSYIILYNDAPAPVPAFDPRNDYYTNNTDLSVTGANTGGAPSTVAGYGPNTRTILRFYVSGTQAASYDITTLTTALAETFSATQPAPVVSESAYNDLPRYPTRPDTYSLIQDNALTYKPYVESPPFVSPDESMSVVMAPRAIQEGFELNYGRMNAVLGSELPFTNDGTQTTVVLGFIDPPVEHLVNDEIQLWKITHNGVDTHAIHFHLFNVQVVNRIGWDGAIRPPDPNELGWKEVVRMNPLEDIVVALRPESPYVPDSWGWNTPTPTATETITRPLDPTADVPTILNPGGGTPPTFPPFPQPPFILPSTQWRSFDPLTGGGINYTNVNNQFGQEYMWHCHLLGHEENDMMRPMTFQLAAARPIITDVSYAGGTTTVTIDPGIQGFFSKYEYCYTVTAVPAKNSFALSPTSTTAHFFVTPSQKTVTFIQGTATALTPGVQYSFSAQEVQLSDPNLQTDLLQQAVMSQYSFLSTPILIPE
jgi:FtsP/CotA-like multicopper oxidase with cupredoxin domain